MKSVIDACRHIGLPNTKKTEVLKNVTMALVVFWIVTACSTDDKQRIQSNLVIHTSTINNNLSGHCTRTNFVFVCRMLATGLAVLFGEVVSD